VDPIEFYLREGAAVRARIERLLPPGWTFDGTRVLDFGCGSARVLRHFLEEAERAEFWGCDIDGPSVDWARTHFSPPMRFEQNRPEPPLPFAAGAFDLVWATSVFTHIDRWSEWIAEMHRVLAPGGMLIASFLGEGMWEALVGEPYREDEVGMTVRRHWQDGPWVLHSEWWLREHWGRAFDVDAVARPPRDADGRPQVTHSYIAMRKRDVAVTREELERIDPAEPREPAGLRTNVRLLRAEIDELVAARPGPVSWMRGRLRASPMRAVRRRLRAPRRG
jgi:SAM-dependent methyltransferase